MTESEINLSPKQREQFGRDAATFQENMNAGRSVLLYLPKMMERGAVTMERAAKELHRSEDLVNAGQLAGQRCIDLIGRATDTVFKQEGDLLSLPDLSLLASMDSADTRRLCDLLEAAQVVADRIDAARGRAVADHVAVQPGEARGMDLGELVNNVLVRVRGEAYGAASSRE